MLAYPAGVCPLCGTARSVVEVKRLPRAQQAIPVRWCMAECCLQCVAACCMALTPRSSEKIIRQRVPSNRNSCTLPAALHVE